MRSFGLVLFVLVCCKAVAVPPAGDCHRLASGMGRYCVLASKRLIQRNILYYFHGSGGSESSWNDELYFTSQIREYWKNRQMVAPTVVSVSYGPDGLLAQKNSSMKSGRFEDFVEIDFPEIEKRVGFVPRQRTVLGESMGAFNSIQLALKTSLFSKAAILCAPIANGVSPFSSETELATYVKNSTVWQYYLAAHKDPTEIFQSVAAISRHSKAYFPREDEWRSADPIVLARTTTNNRVSLYLASGYYDRFVAYEGNKKFAEALKSRGIDVNWRPQWGGHCAIDIPSVASFLAN